MQLFLRGLLRWSLRLFVKLILTGRTPIWIQRPWSALVLASSRPPRGTRAEPINMNGVRAERVTTAHSGSRVLLYFHGGGYCIGSARGYRPLAAHIARATAAVAYVPDYRLAPEHPHPAALEDALAAYRWLLAQDNRPTQIVIGGDSAGGGLALATTVAIRDAGLALPAALILISPWTDLTLSGESIRTHSWREPMLSPALISLWSRLYLGGQPAQQPSCSPLFADLNGLPPLLIQVGSEEILLSDSQRLEQRAREAGVVVNLSIYDKLWHIFQAHAGLLRASDSAITEIGDFVKNTIAVA